MIAFLILGALAVAGAIVTITAKNAVHAALGLVFTLLNVAGIFATLSASFLAATQVIVYAGAIMVLFLFVIMLLNATQPITSHDPVPYVREVAWLGGSVLIGALMIIALNYKDALPLKDGIAGLRGTVSQYTTLPELAHRAPGSAAAVGEVLLTKFVFPFEAVSILLLVAIVGAVTLVSRPANQTQGETAQTLEVDPEPAALPERGTGQSVVVREEVRV